MPVNLKELVDAFEIFAMGNELGEHTAFVCRESGKIYYRFGDEDDELDGEFNRELNNELPDDIEDEEKYVPLPDKRELNLGKSLVLDFAHEFLPNDVREIHSIFSKRGAYHRFKDLLERRDLLQQWYDFEAKATERALRGWCELNEIAVTD